MLLTTRKEKHLCRHGGGAPRGRLHGDLVSFVPRLRPGEHVHDAAHGPPEPAARQPGPEPHRPPLLDAELVLLRRRGAHHDRTLNALRQD
jgi:hypothetical protein